MPLAGPILRWPFSEKEDVGQYREAEQSLQSLTDWINSTTLSLTGLTPASYTSSPRQAGKSVMPSLTLSNLRATARLLDEMEQYRPRIDDSLDALRYNIYQSPIYSPSIATMIMPQADYEPKEPEMNEIMTALEAMIRRVVKEEIASTGTVSIAFADGLKDYVNLNSAEWAAIVSQGALDKPWFDDAIKSEVVAAVDSTPALGGGFAFATADEFNKHVRDFVREDGNIEDWLSDMIIDRVQGMDFSADISVR